MNSALKVVDLFAGPGGLGEGFSAFSTGGARDAKSQPFRIVLSAEKDTVAHATLRLRAFYRQFSSPEEVPQEYYRHIAGLEVLDIAAASAALRRRWARAEEEARCLTLGNIIDDRILDRHLGKELRGGVPWVLIGGPPCQAYSLVGRARNRGIADYRPEADHRHFLYREYLRIIRKFRPAVFVMENVKGILSASVNGQRIFGQILADLQDPVKAFGSKPGRKDQCYRLVSLSTGKTVGRDNPDHDVDPREFIVAAENYGVPQRRHRVFVVGIREDVATTAPLLLPLAEMGPVSIGSVLSDLPHLRSGVSGRNGTGDRDGWDGWKAILSARGEDICKGLRSRGKERLLGNSYAATAGIIEKSLCQIRSLNREMPRGVGAVKGSVYGATFRRSMPDHLKAWFRNDRLLGFCNHETRTHIESDLDRYLFCAAWGSVTYSSPKASDFPGFLAPRHENWETGKFADRFRVQLSGEPATTITSHISKDGHYFIHYDPVQCRSLTVREAARIQTFPDDYFFEGPRTQQYTQVGNAVPPYLARQIAAVVWRAIDK